MMASSEVSSRATLPRVLMAMEVEASTGLYPPLEILRPCLTAAEYWGSFVRSCQHKRKHCRTLVPATRAQQNVWKSLSFAM